MDDEDIFGDETQPSQFREFLKTALLAMIVLPLAYGTYKWVSSNIAAEAVHSCGGGAGMAQIMAEKFVKIDLKAPSTASFSRSSVESGKGCTFRVDGVVDAQNSFGAMLRKDYSITIRYNADSNKWSRMR